jgi:hypothetical protein
LKTSWMQSADASQEKCLQQTCDGRCVMAGG